MESKHQREIIIDNALCTIENKGYALFCNFENKGEQMNTIITTNTIINDDMIVSKEEINIILCTKQIIKIVLDSTKRKIYSFPMENATIIQIFKKEIPDFVEYFEVDPQFFETGTNNYPNTNIMIYHSSDTGNPSSYKGIITEIDNVYQQEFPFCHKSNIPQNITGAAIINENNKKLIGINVEIIDQSYRKQGVFVGYFVTQINLLEEDMNFNFEDIQNGWEIVEEEKKEEIKIEEEKKEEIKVEEEKKDDLKDDKMQIEEEDIKFEENKEEVKEEEPPEDKDLGDPLENIYSKLCNNNFKSKPKLLNLSPSNLNSEQQKFLSELSKITKFSFVSPLEILYKEQYEISNKISKERDKCSICLGSFYEDDIPIDSNIKDKSMEEIKKIPIDVILFEKCEDHFFHIDCINNYIGKADHFKCPCCSKIYGILKGTMPPGTMSVYYNKSQHCEGYKEGTIEINYNFPSGRGFAGTSRTCYLPYTTEGLKVLALLKVSFERRITFKVGESVTTGVKNTTVWNGIHHKTSLYGGPTNFGFPDDQYFSRVKEELAVNGVTEDSIKGDLINIAKEFIKKGHIENKSAEGIKLDRE